VYHVVPYTLTSSRDELTKIGYLKRFRDWARIQPQETPVGICQAALSSLWLRHLYRSARTWLTVRDARGYLTTQRGPYPSDEEIASLLHEQRGYVCEIKRMNSEQEWEADAARYPEAARPFLADGTEAGLRRLFEQAQARRFALLVVMNPVPEAWRNPQTDEAYQAVEQALRALAVPYPRVQVAAPLLRYYPNEQAAAFNHLTADGARRNSRELVEWARPMLPQ
jgi:hypothetical protein